MSYDSSRFTFNPWKDFSGVVMQQGRVQLDSDWNEWLAELSRRIRAGTLDTVGRAVYPATTPNAFKIVPSSSGAPFAIGVGRMYVDGLLAENHGLTAPLFEGWVPGSPSSPSGSGATWDDSLDELYINTPVDYDKQPYYPNAPLPTSPGPYLIYLDVWQREVTFLEDPDLIEKAVGIDTTGRLQTICQVKWSDVSSVEDGVTCSTPDSSLNWPPQPSGGRLTTGVVQSSPSGPCCLTPNTGYTGMENQLYRVEINVGGGVGAATFKWSRDNASVETAVTGIASGSNSLGNPASQLTVQSLGKDQVLGFSAGNWIEIIDDYLELNGQPGELHKIDSIGPASLTITLDSLVSSTNFPVVGGQAIPSRHTRIRRWDQAHTVVDTTGATVVNLDSSGSTGDIPVPASGTAVVLENGVTVSFDLDPSNPSFNPGDFWTFAARTVDGTVESLVEAPPRGIYHHYARLAVLTLPLSTSNPPSDCRIEWPPTGCCCTVTVVPSDAQKPGGLQAIIDRAVMGAAAATVCFGPGVYSLPSPLRLGPRHSNFKLEGCQEWAILQAAPGAESKFRDGLVVLSQSDNVTVEGLAFSLPLVPFLGAKGTLAGLDPGLFPQIQPSLTRLAVSIGIRPLKCNSLTVRRCKFTYPSFASASPETGSVNGFAVGILSGGGCVGLAIEENDFEGGTQPTAHISAEPFQFLIGYALNPVSTISGAKVEQRNIAFQDVSSLAGVALARPAAPVTGGGGTVLRRASGTSLSAPIATIAAPPAAATGPTAPVAAPPAAVTAPIAVKGSKTKRRGKATAPAATTIDPSSFFGFTLTGQGTFLPAWLQEASFRGNKFSNLTLGILIVGETGSLRIQDNDVIDSYAGAWLFPRRSPVPAPFSQSQSELEDIAEDPVIVIASAIARGYPLPDQFSDPSQVSLELSLRLVLPGAPSPLGALLDVYNILSGTIESSLESQAAQATSPSTAQGFNFHLQCATNSIDGQLAATGLGSSNEVDIYNTITSSWTLGPPLLTPRRSFATDTDNNSIWVAGGYDGTGVPTASMEIFDAKTNSWSPGPADIPSAGVGLVGVYFPTNGKFYAMGGRSSDRAGSDFTHPFEYDPVAKSWTTKSATYPDNQVNNMACGLLTVAEKQYICCVGGSAAGAATGTARVFLYDPIADNIITSLTASDNWPGDASGTIVPGGFAVTPDNKLYILGGFEINVASTEEIWRFDPSAAVGSRWTKLASTPEPLINAPTCTLDDGKIYAAGASDYQGGKVVDTTNSFSFDPTTNNSVQIAPILRDITQATTRDARAVNFNGNMWVMGGLSVAPKTFNDGEGLIVWGDEKEDTATEVLLTGNRIRNSGTKTAVIKAVSLCSVTGNVILNESQTKGCESLFVSLSGKSTMMAITGNVFQGKPIIANKWNKFNSISL